MKRFNVTIPVQAPDGTEPSDISGAINQLLDVGLADAQSTVEDPSWESEDAELAVSLEIGQPGTEAAGGPEGVVPEAAVLREFIADIEATGGVFRDAAGCHHPMGHEAWVDLGETYVKACKVVGCKPQVTDDAS